MQNNHEAITTALARLNRILPLVERQTALTPEYRQLHRAILHAYVDIGRSLNLTDIAQRVDDIDEAIRIFRESDLVVFDGNDEPLGAYPFTMEERDHVVTINGHNIHCMCALDALAVSPMFNLPTRIRSRCHLSAETIDIVQNGMEISNKEDTQEIFFGIDWSASSSDSCCADSLCTEMIFLKDQSVADYWLGEPVGQRQIFPLNEAIDFAARFFVPLL